MPGTHDCGGDAAAYVLGALEPAEAQEFAKHLEGCAVCRDEVAALRGVVQALPMAAPQQPAPRRLRRRLMHAVGREPRQPIQARQRIRRRAGLVALGAAGVVAAGVLLGVVLAGSKPGAREFRAQVTGVAGRAELRVAGGVGELLVHRLTPPPAGHVYEVWLKAAAQPPRPANVLFDVSAAGSADVLIPESLKGVTQVMVTPEPAGGSAAPTHAPVIVARLS